MSKEMTAEGYLEYQYVTTDITGDIKLTTVIAAKHYGDLRAKEAVKEFAEELMKKYEDKYLTDEYVFLNLSELKSGIKHLAKQKGVEI